MLAKIIINDIFLNILMHLPEDNELSNIWLGNGQWITKGLENDLALLSNNYLNETVYTFIQMKQFISIFFISVGQCVNTLDWAAPDCVSNGLFSPD